MKNYLDTHASEVEDLYDSTGADGLPDRSTFSVVGLDIFSAPEEEREGNMQGVKDSCDGLQAKEPKLPDQLSANDRTVLRKHFCASTPIVLPRGHTTIAFSELEIRALLVTFSKENVRSSLHTMRALVLQAVYWERGQTVGQFQKALIRGEGQSGVSQYTL